MAKDKAKHANSQTVTTEPITQEQTVKEQTIEELMSELQTALSRGDYKAVATISRKIDQRERAREKAELDEKRAVVKAMEDTVKSLIVESITPLINSGDLDKADGIWFAYDFGEESPTVRLLKTSTKSPRTGGGGTGKKFDISTDDMLTKHGGEVYKDGLTFREAYDQNTDKNWRYAIRLKLLKIEGLI